MEAVGRRRLAIALVAIGTVSCLLALCSLWVKRQVLETDQWAETSGKLLEDDEIRTAIAQYLSNNVLTGDAVQQRLEEALPPRLDPLAGLAAGAFRQAARRAALELLENPKVQDLWVQANTAAQQQLVALVDDEPVAAGALDAAGERLGVELDLSSIRERLAEQLGLPPPTGDGTVGDAATAAIQQGDATAAIEVLAPDQLELAQDVGGLLKSLPIVLILLTLALYGGAIGLAAGHRRTMLAGCGLSLLIAGTAVLAIRVVAGDALVDALASSTSIEPSVLATWLIGTALLGQMAVATIAYALVILAGTWLAGPSGIATRARELMQPVAVRPIVTYSVLALALLLLIAWSPTPAFAKPLGIGLLTILLVAGLEALRRQVASEAARAST